MRIVRAAILTLHVAALAFGVYVAGAAVDSFFVNVGTDITTVAMSRLTVAASLIAVALHYGIAIAEIVVVAAVAFLAWRWAKSRSHFPLI